MNYRAVPASLVHLSRKSLRLGYVPRYPAPAIMRRSARCSPPDTERPVRPPDPAFGTASDCTDEELAEVRDGESERLPGTSTWRAPGIAPSVAQALLASP